MRMHRNVQVCTRVVLGQVLPYNKMDVRRVQFVCKADYTVEVHGFSIEAFEPSLPIIVRERAFGRRMFPRWCTSSQTSFSC